MKPTLILTCLLCIVSIILLHEYHIETLFTRYTRDDITLEIYFCPIDPCKELFTQYIVEAETLDCALFDASSEILSLLQKKEARLVFDDRIQLKNAVTDRSQKYMHNKFCIRNGKTVLTGSMNPTENGMTKNNNNLIIIHSEKIAQNYLNEFNEMFEKREFQDASSQQVLFPVVGNEHIRIENYFCPEDNCEYHVLKLLASAQESIYFMTFSFTSDAISELLLKKHEEGISIKGIFEKQQISQWSEYELLASVLQEKIRIDQTLGKMHHKVFIVDSAIVLTGSYNPSQNGNKNNDENIVIIHNTQIAGRFLNEFQRLWDQSEKGN
jgi:phosphatidylserine/phosphatidylglycerophosphate/cardiolipin synthase-like enzyme